MTQKLMVPVSYNGVGLHMPGARSAIFDLDSGAHNTPAHRAISFDRIGKFPSRVREQPTDKVFPLRFVFESCDVEGQFFALSRIFDPTLGPRLLVTRDGNGVLKQVSCVPTQIVNDGDGSQNDREWVVALAAARPLLENVEQTTITDDLDDALTHQYIVNNIGTYFAQPLIEIEPLTIKTAAQAWKSVREVTFAHRSELALTGPAADAWLIEVTNGGWDTAALVAAGQMLASGDDIAIFIDEIQVPPSQVYINGMNTATTKIWVKITDGARTQGTLESAVAAGATTFPLKRADHGFTVGDFIVWNDSGGAKQMALIGAIDGKTLTVERAVRNTPNANATAADTVVYRSGRHIQIAYNWTAAPARPTLEDVPIPDLAASSNSAWEFNLGPFWADGNRKPGGMRRIIYPGRDDVPALRQNRSAFKTVLASIAGLATFSDAEPSGVAPNFDALEFVSPVGIDNVAGAIEYDAIVGYAFSLQIIQRDMLGIEALLASRMGHESGDSHEPPHTYTNQQETPGQVLSAVIFRARNVLVTGVTTGDDVVNREDMGLGGVSADTDYQDFVLDALTRIDGIVVRLRRVSAVDAACFLTDSDGNGAPNLPINSEYTHTMSGAGPLNVCFHEPAGFVATESGTYHVTVYQDSGVAGNLQWMKAVRSLFARGAHWEADGANFNRVPDEDMFFFILSESVDNQEDMEVGRTGEAVVLDNIKITFDPDRTMIVDPRPAEDAYYINTTIGLGNDQLAVKYLKRWADNNIVTIDTLTKSIYEGKNNLGLRQVLESATDEWLLVPTGASNISIAAPNGAVQEQVRLKYRDTWQ